MALLAMVLIKELVDAPEGDRRANIPPPFEYFDSSMIDKSAVCCSAWVRFWAQSVSADAHHQRRMVHRAEVEPVRAVPGTQLKRE